MSEIFATILIFRINFLCIHAIYFGISGIFIFVLTKLYNVLFFWKTYIKQKLCNYQQRLRAQKLEVINWCYFSDTSEKRLCLNFFSNLENQKKMHHLKHLKILFPIQSLTVFNIFMLAIVILDTLYTVQNKRRKN